MKNKYFSAVMAALFFLLPAISNAQFDSLKFIRISGGMADPRGPISFYDYWKIGFHAEGEAVFKVSEQHDLILAAEYNFFPFDEDRFFQKIKMDNRGVSVDGATSSLIVITGNINYGYFGKGDESTTKSRPYVSMGAGGIISLTSESKVNYPLAPKTGEGKFSISPCIRIGFGLQTSLTEIFSWFAEVNYLYGVLADNSINTDFATFRAGVSFVP